MIEELTLTIRVTKQDGKYTGQIKEVPDCISFGSNLPEVLENLGDALRELRFVNAGGVIAHA